MITVRPYQKKDYRYVQEICVETSSHGKDSLIHSTVLCELCCDYYLENQPSFCFVAVDESDIPVGYVLCAVDLDNYKEQMTEEYLPLVRKLNGGAYFDYLSEMKLEQRYYKQGYVAHLHLDVCNDLTRGDGSAQTDSDDTPQEEAKAEIQSLLLGAILEKLQNTSLNDALVEGAFVFCKETDALISVLEKHGFKEIDYVSGREVYGKILHGEDE